VWFSLSLQKMHLSVTLPEETLERLRSEASAIKQQSVVSDARTRRFTGKITASRIRPEYCRGRGGS